MLFRSPALKQFIADSSAVCFETSTYVCHVKWRQKSQMKDYIDLDIVCDRRNVTPSALSDSQHVGKYKHNVNVAHSFSLFYISRKQQDAAYGKKSVKKVTVKSKVYLRR